MSLHTCESPDCGRAFLDKASLLEHAEAVHTFDDVRQTVAEAVREKWGSKGNGQNGEPRVYVWLADIADDWCVFQLEVSGGDTSLQKVSYGITDGEVNFGEAYEVTRRTVYERVGATGNASLEGAAAGGGDAQMLAAQKVLAAAQFATYKKLRAKGMAHPLAMQAAKKVKA